MSEEAAAPDHPPGLGGGGHGQVLDEVDRVVGGGDGGQVVEVVDEHGGVELVYLEADEVEVVGEADMGEVMEVAEVVEEMGVEGAVGGGVEPDGAVGLDVEDVWVGLEALQEVAVEEVVWRRRRA